MTVNASLPFFISSLELAQWHIVPGVDCIVKGFHKMAFFLLSLFLRYFAKTQWLFCLFVFFWGGVGF